MTDPNPLRFRVNELNISSIQIRGNVIIVVIVDSRATVIDALAAVDYFADYQL